MKNSDFEIGSNIWNITSNNLKLSSDHIDIWKISLDSENERIFTHAKYLSAEEHTRADKYVSGKKAREFIITRSSLRHILGHVLCESPRLFEFIYTKHGMPTLSPASGHPDVIFSVSHSFDLALIAITMNQPVGIDIEKMRTDIDYEKLAKRFFSDNEFESIMNYEGQQRLRAFFATWTRKEAIVKALGTGIASGLKSFDVSVDPEASAVLRETRWGPEITSDWDLHKIVIGDDYFATLASTGSTREVRCWTMD